ncbi:MAG: hypothetical protein ACLFR1_13575 [Spirochaetia bacterium]
MKIHYYFSIFPMEALIASQLEPEEFGSYMATGSKKGTAEQLMFIELTEEFGSFFDWDYAHKHCVVHKDGRPKNSSYLSVYRVLENIELDKLGAMYLVTKDGRSLKLEKSGYEEPDTSVSYNLYQELCPIHPLVVSKLSANEFGRYLASDENKIFVPQIVFADLKVVNIEDPEHTGNVGALYSRNIEHLKECIKELEARPDKRNKTLDRTHVESFGFQNIGKGVFISNTKEIVMYKMKTIDELQRDYFPWAKSANIL